MSYYYYNRVVPNNAESWIGELAIINNYTGYANHYDEIHFTLPKEADMTITSHAHVTFIRGWRQSHFYLVKSGKNWVATLRGKAAFNQGEEQQIARKVVSDMLERGWINPPLGKLATDDDGWSTKTTKKQRETSW